MLPALAVIHVTFQRSPGGEELAVGETEVADQQGLDIGGMHLEQIQLVGQLEGFQPCNYGVVRHR